MAGTTPKPCVIRFWLLWGPDPDQPNRIQSTLCARLANVAIFDGQLPQAAPKYPIRTMVRDDSVHKASVARVLRKQPLQHARLLVHKDKVVPVTQAFLKMKKFDVKTLKRASIG
jgi:hypothetical protein